MNMAEIKKMNWFERIDLIIFIVSIIIVIISIPLLNKNNCPLANGSLFGDLIAIACKFGLKGIFFFILVLIAFLSLILLMTSKLRKK